MRNLTMSTHGNEIMGVDISDTSLVTYKLALDSFKRKTSSLLLNFRSVKVNSAKNVERECVEIVIGGKIFPVAGDKLVLNGRGDIIALIEGVYILEVKRHGTIGKEVKIDNKLRNSEEFKNSQLRIVGNQVYKIHKKVAKINNGKIYKLYEAKNQIGKMIYNS